MTLLQIRESFAFVTVDLQVDEGVGVEGACISHVSPHSQEIHELGNESGRFGLDIFGYFKQHIPVFPGFLRGQSLLRERDQRLDEARRPGVVAQMGQNARSKFEEDGFNWGIAEVGDFGGN